jgi:hypothetical protein
MEKSKPKQVMRQHIFFIIHCDVTIKCDKSYVLAVVFVVASGA